MLNFQSLTKASRVRKRESVVRRAAPFVIAAVMAVQGAHGQVVRTELRGDAACSLPALLLSPQARYVYFSTSNWLYMAKSDCLLGTDWRSCAFMPVSSHTAMASFFFSPDDRFAYVLNHLDGSADRFDVAAVFDGRPDADTYMPAARSYYSISAYFSTAPGDMAPEAFIRHSADLIGPLSTRHAGNVGINSRDVYGAVHGGNIVALNRTNDMRMYVYDGFTTRPFDENGQAYYEQTANLEFRFAGRLPYVRASGTVLPLTGALPSGDGAREHFISGDDALAYYGKFSQESVTFQNVRADIAKDIQTWRRANPDVKLTGLSLNNGRAAEVISVQSHLRDVAAAQFTDTAYSHRLKIGQKSNVLDCGNPTSFRLSTFRFGGKTGIWVDRYAAQRPVGREIVYLYGGPNEYSDSESSYQINEMLKRGYDVSVLHYDGTTFNYKTSVGLARSGRKRLQENADLIGRYLRSRHADAGRLYLFMDSYAGAFYRLLSDSDLALPARTILYEPFGSRRVSPAEAVARYGPLAEALYRRTLGDELYRAQDADDYYRTNRVCQVRHPVVLVLGAKDEDVNAAYDYRNCLSDPNVTVVRHDGGHSSNLPQNLTRIFSILEQ